MLRVRCVLSLVAILMLPVSQAQAQLRVTNDTGSVIATAGMADITLPPDRAVISLAVESRASTAALAAAANGPRVNRLRTALLATRPQPDSVLVVGLSVGPNENRERATVVDYQARAIIRMTVRSLDSLGRYLDLALSNGATEVVNVRFNSDSADAAKGQVLAQAYAHARRDAEALARAAGGTLGQLLRIDTGPDYSELYDVAAFSSARGYFGEAVPLAPQGVKISARVSAQWRFVGGSR